ncbi:cisplatin damage response ATP-dependent DNA ligase [Sphingomonas sp. ABOLD]|uniref:DNA ligase (ATP) n=1 Tax=Sphingomonas trueperi TaxID=53317 RepID=A0A7X6BDQ6_9SPHN|nr:MULTISPECIES: cisplatin damage response ATP-dependent DNA ligase [Sphingomonas]NJB97997.1 DNA ligase-1 [Sphingomonas trueperi]RSV35000.1 cisplatin damage response ATP-dependent DNA ligase [Sphingomonas sp. ABOLE]RSV43068.1 cisplatin damage response ATP-dependent DNA ligase [Sphingomonas sp. ABOLD]
MRAFADLLDRLIYTRSRNAKLRLIGDYLRVTPDPDRGWAMAALTGALDLPAVKPALLRAMIESRVDPVLYGMSRDFVGDSAETIALLWPEPAVPPPESAPLTLSQIVSTLGALSRSDAPAVLAAMLDRLEADERYALLKLATGALRVGISARLAKTALAQAFGLDVDAVEEVWHGLHPPYAVLFDWAEGRAEQPRVEDVPVFRPFMLAHPLEETQVSLADYAAEWKWDGIRVQLVHAGGETRLYSRAGDDITRSFPEVAAAFATPGVLDGELLVRGEVQGGEAGSFNALQQRLGRKVVSAKTLAAFPAFVRLYDILFDGTEDVREQPWHARRARLEGFVLGLDAERFDISAVIDAVEFAALEEIRAGARDAAIEGVMLKRRDSPYVAGRRVGLWYKWKRDPLTADCVLMYAQRGSGKRSSFYSDFTFGAWTETGELLPVGKAYFGFTDEELKWLDRHVRTHTVNRFGPVRETDKSLVLEVAFDSIHESKRHKSGLAMRFPRIARIRTDKPVAEADTIAGLRRMVT